MLRRSPVTLSYSKQKSVLGGKSASEVLVLGCSRSGESNAAPKSAKSLKELSKAYDLLAKAAHFKAKFEASAFFALVSPELSGLDSHSSLLAMGIGEPKDLTPQTIVSLGGRMAQELNRHKVKSADVFLDSLYNPPASISAADAAKDFAGRPTLFKVPTREEFLELFATGILLGLYTFDRYKTAIQKDGKDKKAPFTINLISTAIDGPKGAKILERAESMAQGVFLVRDLQTTPGNDLPPSEIAKAAQVAGREAGLQVQVWDEKKLKSEGMNGILSVGMGSEAPPRFIIMEHNASKKNLPTIVFVGKGISFDTGGISIKPAQGMHEMKMDMSGSASVIGAMFMLGKLKTPVRAIGLIASAENMPSGRALRPGDVYTALGGKTVEVLNTDAEGRLVLADALVHAKTYNPDCVIDLATLTGAVTIALGSVTTGLMGNNAALIEGYNKASHNIGERCWELPLYPEYQDDMKSKVADIANIGSDRGAGSQKGGAFLNYFVDGAYPWIHLDIAATADTPKGQGSHCPVDVGTGVPMRGLVEFAENFDEYFKSKKKK